MCGVGCCFLGLFMSVSGCGVCGCVIVVVNVNLVHACVWLCVWVCVDGCECM